MSQDRPAATYDVFLSHSHADAQIVTSLADWLTDEAGLAVWLDRWQPAMARGLDQARACAVCAGRETPRGWFRKVDDYAAARDACQRAIEIVEPFLPPNHPHVQIVRGNLAACRARLDRE